MFGVRLLGMELRPPPASLGGRERLYRAGVARREDAKPLGQDSDLIGVILEDDGVFGQVAQQVAAIVDPDREESVLDALSDVDRPSANRARSCIPPQMPKVGRAAARTASPSSSSSAGSRADQAAVDPLRTMELALASRRGSTSS